MSTDMADPLAPIAAALQIQQPVRIVIPGPPVSKSSAYQHPHLLGSQERTAGYLKAAVAGPFEGNVGMACIFLRPNKQRIDADNLLKHMCDAGTGVLWLDDSQCTKVAGVVEVDPDNPRTIVFVGPASSSLTRGVDAAYPCAQCGQPIYPHGDGRLRRTCAAPACVQAAKGYRNLDRLVECAHCGWPFRRRSSYTTLCSTDCRAASVRGKRKAARRPNSRCADCDVQLAHRRGGRCRDCWRAQHVRRAS